MEVGSLSILNRRYGMGKSSNGSEHQDFGANMIVLHASMRSPSSS
jgi:hypothetical protein